jgi:membrane-associated phospholipid phosphatase
MKTFARWVSILGHPFVMVSIMVTAVALRFSAPAQAVRSLLIVLLVTVAPVAGLMALQVRRGAWKDVDASEARQRPILFVVGALGLVCLLGYLLLAHPQSFLIRGVLGSLAMVAVCAVATRWLKVSLHMAFGTLAATTLLLLGSAIGWLLLAVLPVLGWSRVFLSRHKPAEVLAGVIIGLAAGIAMYNS